MLTSVPKWLQSLQTTSLFRVAPQDAQQRKMEALAYVDLFAQFTVTDSFPDDIHELVRGHYPSGEAHLFDEVLGSLRTLLFKFPLFVLHQPEQAHTVLHALLSCVIDGTLCYSKEAPPFRSVISLFDQGTETECPDQWGLACKEILRFLTYYNGPVHKIDAADTKEDETSNTRPSMSISEEVVVKGKVEEPSGQEEKGVACRPLTPWITDILLAAPNDMRRDYFRWCVGITGIYLPVGELRPPITVGRAGEAKQLQLVAESTQRWAVANGGGVMLSVCNDEVLRYQSADLTAAAVPALLVTPEASDRHQDAGLPPLEPYGRLLHRYYAIATPDATKNLLSALLQAPSFWVQDASDAAVQLIALVRAAEDRSSTFQLPENWLHCHFLDHIGTLMRSGVAAEAAAACMLQILSQPALLFPPQGYVQAVRVSEPGCELPGFTATREEMEATAVRAIEEATARALATSMIKHGPDVERRMCLLWDLAYGLLPLDSPSVDVLRLVAATPLHRPVLSWNLFRPLLRVIEHLPWASPSQICMCQIFTATVESVLLRAFPFEESNEHKSIKPKGLQHGGSDMSSKNASMAELRSMVQWLFTEMCPAPEVAAHLLASALTQCLSRDVLRQKKLSEASQAGSEAENSGAQDKKRKSRPESLDDRGAVATFDSYLIAAVCALACEVQLVAFVKTAAQKQSYIGMQRGIGVSFPEPVVVTSKGIPVAIEQAKRVLRILEALLDVIPSSMGAKPQGSSGYSEIVTAAVVAAHVSSVLGNSRACLQALNGIVQSNWDVEISTKASSVLGLVQEYVKDIAEVTDAAGQSSATGKTTEGSESSAGLATAASVSASTAKVVRSTLEQTAPVYNMPHQGRAGRGNMRNSMEKTAARLSLSAAHNTVFSGCLNVVLTEKQEIAAAIVPLIWRMLMFTSDTADSTVESPSSRGWYQVVEGLCKLVIACPARATAAIIFKANKDIRSWTSQESVQGETVWMSNRRILTLLTELLRLKRVLPVVQAIAKASEVLLRATDGLKLEVEGCVLPQLELLQTAAMTVLQQSSSGALNLTPWIAGFIDVIKERIPDIVHCLSNRSSHAQALSVAIIRDILLSESVVLGFPARGECESTGNLRKAVEGAVTSEVQRRRDRCLSVAQLSSAATTFGFTIPM